MQKNKYYSCDNGYYIYIVAIIYKDKKKGRYLVEWWKKENGKLINIDLQQEMVIPVVEESKYPEEKI